MTLLCVVMLTACSGTAAGLNSFQSPDGRYAFLYPTGWTRVAVTNGPQVVFHDLINSDETVSLVVSDVDTDDELQQLGSAVAVGERLRRDVIAPAGSGHCRQVQSHPGANAHQQQQHCRVAATHHRYPHPTPPG